MFCSLIISKIILSFIFSFTIVFGTVSNLLFGIGISSLIILNYLEDISTYFEMEYLKRKSQRQAREITIEFFANLRHRNPGITLDEAILRFENGEEFYNLKDFATSKSRTAESYREAYSDMFRESAILLV